MLNFFLDLLVLFFATFPKTKFYRLSFFVDTDLHEVLPKISELLGFRVVRMVVRRQGVLSQTTIDNIMDEYPRDASERTYQLLKAWYEKHGMRGASKELCDNLIAISMRSKAEAVRELIKNAQHNSGVEENGNV